MMREGAWATLIQVVRPLLAELTHSPLAAIELRGNGGAELVHQGTDALRPDLSSLGVRAVHWRNSDSAGHMDNTRRRLKDVEASSGWRQALPLDYGFALQPGDRLAVRATFAAYDCDDSVPVSVQTQ
jgi:hypothetical protein